MSTFGQGSATAGGEAGHARSAYVLPLICVAEFMVILDVSIVNIALPSIQRDLDVKQSDLQWVVTAYQLALGGFLLLGGRFSDLLGRRRMLVAGVSLFTLSSLVCALSNDIGVLVAGRAAQGLGSAMTLPAALSILTNVYAEGRDRDRALGIFGAIAGSGAAVGSLLGGFLTSQFGWEWNFYINVPVGVAVLVMVPRVLPGWLDQGGATRHFDVAGAVLVTGGLVAGVYGANRSIEHGWTDGVTLLCLALAVVLIAAFLVTESRTRVPLLPLSMFRLRSVSVANGLAVMVFGTVFGSFFLLSLYMQQVLGYSALRAGFAYLPMALLTIFSAAGSAQVAIRVGAKPVIVVGMLMMVVALALFSRLPADGSYVPDLLPGYVLVGIGLGLAVVGVQVAAFTAVPEDRQGLAAGLINTSQEVGGAVLVATVATVAFSRTRSLLSDGTGDPLSALTDGFQRGFLVMTVLGVAAVVLALVGLPHFVAPPPVAAATAAGAAGSLAGPGHAVAGLAGADTAAFAPAAPPQRAATESDATQPAPPGQTA